MERVIWKFPFKSMEPVIEIEMPKKAEILTVQVQNGRPCLWAMVNPKEEKETRYLSIVGTGHKTKQETKDYITTFQMAELVWHVFEGVVL